MMNDTLEVRAAKGIAEFVSAMIRLAPKHERCFERTDEDADQVSFNLDGYPFTFSWGEATTKGIGRLIPTVKFSLCIWHTTPGSRHSPPESIDTTLIESSSVYDCIRVAFETVAKDEIRNILENDSYEQMVKEEAIAEALEQSI
jgi:hypothetical protein